ncbi:glycosyltransferase [bacterium]|nr:glycosyltransferase [bacterium]
MTQFRDIAIIIPLFNEMQYIATLTRDLAALSSPIPFQVYFIDGGSTDGTLAFLNELDAPFEFQVLNNPHRLPAGAMNVGVHNSSEELIVRLDGHTGIQADYLEQILGVFERHPEIGATGAALTNCGKTWFGRSNALAMSSPFGMGGAATRVGGDQEREVDTIAFPCYPRRVAEVVGDVDLNLPYSEDDEYNFRITKQGFRILYNPFIKARYFVRETPLQLLRQMWNYGRGKVRTLRKHGGISNLRQLAPPLFVAYLLLLPLLLKVSGLLLLPAGLWLLLAILMALRLNLLLSPTIVIAFLIMHIGYGSGYLWQLLTGRGEPKRGEE